MKDNKNAFSKLLPVMIVLTAIVGAALPSYSLALRTEKGIQEYYHSALLNKQVYAANSLNIKCVKQADIFNLRI
ncbi:MAG: hypothetical protein LBR90_02510 [Elusimicrobiota bacterium]|nr:hypothetical protein [Elusimicrobiota bacterium]